VLGGHHVGVLARGHARLEGRVGPRVAERHKRRGGRARAERDGQDVRGARGHVDLLAAGAGICHTRARKRAKGSAARTRRAPGAARGAGQDALPPSSKSTIHSLLTRRRAPPTPARHHVYLPSRTICAARRLTRLPQRGRWPGRGAGAQGQAHLCAPTECEDHVAEGRHDRLGHGVRGAELAARVAKLRHVGEREGRVVFVRHRLRPRDLPRRPEVTPARRPRAACLRVAGGGREGGRAPRSRLARGRRSRAGSRGRHGGPTRGGFRTSL